MERIFSKEFFFPSYSIISEKVMTNDNRKGGKDYRIGYGTMMTGDSFFVPFY
jgi:hypothetical protein